MAELNFNANEVEPSKSFEPIPAAKYPMIFTESEMKPTKNGKGEYLQFTAEVIEGEYQGRLVWVRLNLVNDNTQAVEIAQRELSAICHAVGIMNPKDSCELHDKPFIAKVGIQPASGQYDASNEIKDYEQYSGTTTTETKEAAPAAKKKPWEK